jgi:hypothetical protein
MLGKRKYVVYRSGHKLVHMEQDSWRRWEVKMQERHFGAEWEKLKAQYPLVAQDLTESQAIQYCRLADEEYEDADA